MKKKEFITTWSRQPIALSPNAVNKMTIAQTSFFDPPAGDGGPTDAVLPDDIKFLDLLPLVGQRTKITIEVIPW